MDEEFLTFVTTHPSEIAVGIFYTPFPLNGKAFVRANSLEACIFKPTDKSKFDVKLGFSAPSAKCKIENVKCKMVDISSNIITFSFNFAFCILPFAF